MYDYEQINKIIRLKTLGSSIGFLKKIYLAFSDYKIIDKIGSGKCLIFYNEDLIKRPDFRAFLAEIQRDINDTSLVICKRVLDFKFYIPTQKKLFNFVENFDLSKNNCVIVFCPHTMLGNAFTQYSSSIGKCTICLQHGYYSFESNEYEIFKNATRCDYALAYDRRYEDFYSNCNNIFYVGSYGIYQKIKPIVHYNTMLFLPYINSRNLKLVRSLVNEFVLKENSLAIKIHPRQNVIQVRTLLDLSLMNFIFISSRDSNKIGRKNYFIDTTAWMKLDLNMPGVISYQILNGQLSKIENFDTSSNFKEKIRDLILKIR